MGCQILYKKQAFFVSGVRKCVTKLMTFLLDLEG
jgi:hypothetical protein